MGNDHCERYQCFACRGMKCKVLTESITDKPCPFFKTDAELQADRKKALDRLGSIGRSDLAVEAIANKKGYAI